MKKILTIASSIVLLSTFSFFANAAEPDSMQDKSNQEQGMMNDQGMINDQGMMNEQEMTLAELSKYNGKNGNKAYVAVDGIIYDVTNAEGWKDGVHTKAKDGKIVAGTDLSEMIKKAPHEKAVLTKLPKVGKLKK